MLSFSQSARQPGSPYRLLLSLYNPFRQRPLHLAKEQDIRKCFFFSCREKALTWFVRRCRRLHQNGGVLSLFLVFGIKCFGGILVTAMHKVLHNDIMAYIINRGVHGKRY
jgi:hypothetical protein